MFSIISSTIRTKNSVFEKLSHIVAYNIEFRYISSQLNCSPDYVAPAIPLLQKITLSSLFYTRPAGIKRSKIWGGGAGGGLEEDQNGTLHS